MRLHHPLLLLLALGALAGNATATEPFRFASTPGRLPKDAVPLAYRIEIEPDIAARSFAGKVSIDVEVRARTATLTLNGAELHIDGASLARQGSAAHAVRAESDEAGELIVVHPDRPLDPGRYQLALRYHGKIHESPNGLYADSYPGPQGTRTLLGTQLESTDARRVFPCWDEPVFRATFQLTAILPAAFQAYSNMPIRHSTPLSHGRRRVEFGTTPKMASYLVALAAGEFERVSTRSAGVEVGVAFTAGKAAGARQPLESAARLLAWYDDYFGIRFPLPKLDNVAVPGGFQGAMENWGDILYNEVTLLHDPATSPERGARLTFEVIAHEMAHQWFGDLVTTAWWDDLWLNEGFASWMATKASDHFHPEWQVWLHANGERERAMELDGRAATHPIQQTIHNETEAADAFDEITYLKGQSFLRMLEVYLGEDEFRDGIRAYLRAHQYSSATTADLWAALEHSSGRPVGRIARDWTETPGFPLVSVDARCEGDDTVVSLAQQRFRSDGGASGDQLWQIPLALRGEDGVRHVVLLGERRQELRFAGCSRMLVADPDAVGYFRVAYAPALQTALQARLPQLPTATRLKLLADGWGLFGAGQTSLGDYLGLLRQLGLEPERAVWSEVLTRLDKLRHLAHGDAEAESRLAALATGLARPRLEQLGWTPRAGESSEEGELRAALIRVLGDFDDPAVLGWAEQQFDAWRGDPRSVPTGLVDAMLTTVGQHAGAERYAQLSQALLAAQGTEEAMRRADALAQARDPALAQRTLELARSGQLALPLRNQLPLEVAQADHADLVWQDTLSHWEGIQASLSSFFRSHYLGMVLSDSADPQLADALLREGRSRVSPDAVPQLERDAELIRVEARLKARVLQDLHH